MRHRAFQLVCCAAGLVTVVSPLLARAADTVVTGVVRDRAGVPQIDALVQLLRLDASVASVARTDDRGFFSMPHLLPGTYQLRATEISFLPALRERLRVAPNQRTVANVTLSTLLDTIDVLPAERRSASEPEDDWKWTLRSSANRPLLRFADDGSNPLSEAPRSTTAIRLTVKSETGTLGQSGTGSVIDLKHDSADGRRMLLRAGVDATSGSAAEFMAGFAEPLAPGRTLRAIASIMQASSVEGAPSMRGLDAMLLRTAETIDLSPEWTAEVGNAMEAVSLGSSGGQIASRPFGSLAWQNEGTTLRYEASTESSAQRSDAFPDEDNVVPAASFRHGRLALEHGLHQELRLAQKTGDMEVGAAAFDDRIANPLLQGGGLPAGPLGGDLLIDPSSHTLRAQGPDYGGAGWMAESRIRFQPGTLLLTAEISAGPALVADASSASLAGPGRAASVEQVLETIHSKAEKAALVSASGKFASTGTRWRAAYRWQPSDTLTAVDPFNTELRDAYLSILLRQPMHLGRVFPGGAEAWVDVRNLLAQGYYPFLASDGSTLFFAQMDRAVQGGIAFTF